MRKVTLILVTVFMLILANNAFGQWHPEIDRVKGKVKTTKIKPRNPKGFTEVSGLSIETQRRKRPRRKSAQYNPKEVGIDKIKARKSKSSIIFDDTDGAEKVTRKKPNGIMQDYYPHSNIRSKTTRKASKSEVSMETVERRKRSRKRNR